MKPSRVRRARLAAVLAATAAVTTACGLATASSTSSVLTSGPTGRPLTIGISLPLTGSFATDGLATERGYQLWASDVNANGGLLGRPVRLKILNDKSDDTKPLTAPDYTTLIKQDHVPLILAPFSSLLTSNAEPITSRYGYALIAGSAGAPAVFANHYNDIFSTTVPVPVEMSPMVQWVLSQPLGSRPTTAAYAMVDDPFADPPVQHARTLLQRGGIQTVFSHAPYNAASKPSQLAADAKAVAQSNAQMVLIGSVDVPTVSAFIKEFIHLRYNPKIIIASAGPDQGQSFLNAIGTGDATGIMVPNGWYGGLPNALSHVMVQSYISTYGGTASDINADVAEAYSAGEVLTDAVKATHSISNKKIIAYLHSGVEMQTVVGPVAFGTDGHNSKSTPFIFQWQQGAHFNQVLPAKAPGSVGIIPVKPVWGG